MMERPARIYIAGPISNGGTLPHEAQRLHVEEACRVAGELLRRGYVPFVPHLTWYWAQLIGADGPADWSLWVERYDPEWLRHCDALLRLPGESKGAELECEEMLGLGRCIFESREDLYANMAPTIRCSLESDEITEP